MTRPRSCPGSPDTTASLAEATRVAHAVRVSGVEPGDRCLPTSQHSRMLAVTRVTAAGQSSSRSTRAVHREGRYILDLVAQVRWSTDSASDVGRWPGELRPSRIITVIDPAARLRTGSGVPTTTSSPRNDEPLEGPWRTDVCNLHPLHLRHHGQRKWCSTPTSAPTELVRGGGPLWTHFAASTLDAAMFIARCARPGRHGDRGPTSACARYAGCYLGAHRRARVTHLTGATWSPDSVPTAPGRWRTADDHHRSAPPSPTRSSRWSGCLPHRARVLLTETYGRTREPYHTPGTPPERSAR